MTESVTRYVVTHINADGMRTLVYPAQGRHTRATEAEAVALMQTILKANSIAENGKLAGSLGLPLEVRAVPCYPGHFDPMQVYFD